MTRRRNFNDSERLVVFHMAGGICQMCGVQLNLMDKWHVDHIIPFVMGGETIIKNAQLLCMDCNLAKGDKMLPEWSRELRRWQRQSLEVFAKISAEIHGTFTLVAFPG